MLYNNNMKELSKIKSIMTRINRKCDKENTSLSNVLKNMNVSNNKFLEIEKIIKQTQPELFKIANDAGRKRRE